MGQLSDLKEQYQERVKILRIAVARQEKLLEEMEPDGKVYDRELIKLKSLYGMLDDCQYTLDYIILGHEPNGWFGIPNLRAGENDFADRWRNDG